MKKISILFLCFIPFSIFSQDSSFHGDDKANYILGYTEGQRMKTQSYIFTYPSFLQGMLDGYGNHVPNSIKDKQAPTTKEYVDWLFNKQTSAFAPAPLNSKTIDTFSYFVGVDYGKDFRKKAFSLDAKSFVQGLKDALSNKPMLYKSSQEILNAFYEQADRIKAQIENNKSLDLVQGQELNLSLTKGITYVLLKASTKPIFPSPKSRVTIHYNLSILDKNKNIVNLIDQRTVSLNISELAEGSKIALLHMQEGEHSLFSIPTSLLFLNEKDWLLTHTLFNVTLISIDSFPSDTSLPLKTLPDVLSKSAMEFSQHPLIPKEKQRVIAKPSSRKRKS